MATALIEEVQNCADAIYGWSIMDKIIFLVFFFQQVPKDSVTKTWKISILRTSLGLQWLYIKKKLSVVLTVSSPKAKAMKKRNQLWVRIVWFFLFFSSIISKYVSWLCKNPSIYNILHWVAWTIGQTNCRPRVWCSFFHTFYRFKALKTLYFYFCNSIKKWENKFKGFLQRILQDIMKKDNAWNIMRLVNDSFVQSSKQPSILFCRLTEFKVCAP